MTSVSTEICNSACRRRMPSPSLRALLITCTLLTLPCHPSPARAAQPSFDCRTAKTLREQAMCRDERLATLDRALSQAYLIALRRVGPAAAAALRRDQEKFVEVMDAGFEVRLVGRNAPARDNNAEAALRAAIASRKDKNTLIPSLEGHLRVRIAMLRGIENGRADVAGTWRNHQATLIVKSAVNGVYEATFQYELWGWFKDHCRLEMSLVANGSGLSATRVRNLDVDEGSMDRPLILTMGTAVLQLEETWPKESNPLPWVCPRLPGIKESLWPIASRR